MRIPSTLLALILSTAAVFAGSVEVKIPWEKAWPVVSPATAPSFGFVLENTGAKPASVKFSAHLTSPSGEEVELEKTLTLNAREKKVDFPLKGREFGPWSLSYEVRKVSDGTVETEKNISFAYFEPMGPNDTHPEFLFGICAHSDRNRGADVKIEVESAGLIGCKVMRNTVEWGTIQPGKDRWNWTVMDDIVSTAAQQGMEIQVMLAFTPRWAAPAEKREAKDWLVWGRAMPDLDGWRTFVSTYAERYKGQIRLFEVWNEPDLAGFWKGSTEDYLKLFDAAREEIKKVDPSDMVMNGGFATILGHHSRALNPDLQEQVMEAAGTKMDAHAVHEHGNFERFVRVVDGPLAKLRASLPAPVPPLIFNETADFCTPGTEAEQAATLVKKVAYARGRGAIGYFWYDLRNDGTDPGNAEHNFGLLTNDMQPKPAYVSFNTVARYMVPRPFVKQLDAGENRWFFLFGDAKDKLLTFWNEDSGSQNEQILLKLPGATKASLIDLYGNIKPLSLNGDLVVVTSSSRPAYLLAENAKGVEPMGRLVGSPRAYFGGPGEVVEVRCEFSNPSTAPVNVKVDWTLPRFVTAVEPAPTKLQIPAQGRAASSIKVKLPEGEKYLFGRSGRLKVSYAFEGMPYHGSLVIPVHYGTIAASAAAAERPADVILDKREQLTSFIEADPHMVSYRWKGPEDLSAKIWARADAKDLVLTVAVTDNKHFQPGPAASMWMADSLQCMLALPGQKGAWEVNVAEDDKDKPLAAISSVPAGHEKFEDKVRGSAEKRGEGRVYTIRLPRKEMGLDDKVLKEGFRFNLAINDNDGEVRAHALQIAPGIVSNKSADSAPYLVIEDAPALEP